MLVFHVAVSFVPGDCSDETTGSPCRPLQTWVEANKRVEVIRTDRYTARGKRCFYTVCALATLVPPLLA